jgi:hypothetical protein
LGEGGWCSRKTPTENKKKKGKREEEEEERKKAKMGIIKPTVVD